MFSKTLMLARSFWGSILLTVLGVLAVYYYMGWSAALVAIFLIAIEITFSFDNAIINAKVLSTMSRFWQQMFMTVGILIAVFGMRVVFPIVVVMMGAGLSWTEVLSLAVNQPDEYSRVLHDAYPSIAAFGGMFLLMLCLFFFLDPKRKIFWIKSLERPLAKIGSWWLPPVISSAVLLAIVLMPFNQHQIDVLLAGALGIGVYWLIHGLSLLFSPPSAAKNVVKTGMAGFIGFMYLELLDASFSLDSVIGAFAITKNVVLIALGLGIGAIWVRSLTVFMVRKHTLQSFRFLEHGAHYTIGILSLVLLIGVFYELPEVIAGGTGIVIITISIISSRLYEKSKKLNYVRTIKS